MLLLKFSLSCLIHNFDAPGVFVMQPSINREIIKEISGEIWK